MKKPMTNTPLDLDRVPDKIDSKFRYVLLASERAEQLMQGARPKLEHPAPKNTRTAMEEVLQDTVTWDYGPAPEPEIPEAPADETLAAEAAEAGEAGEAGEASEAVEAGEAGEAEGDAAASSAESSAEPEATPTA